MSQDDWERGYGSGFIAGVDAAKAQMKGSQKGMTDFMYGVSVEDPLFKRKRPKRKQSGKAKILTAMTAPVWKKYKKGSGKKTYVQIRAQVSRSQAYKRKVKNL
jgi:hypothetical protein